jgi:hypothetical protein
MVEIRGQTSNTRIIVCEGHCDKSRGSVDRLRRNCQPSAALTQCNRQRGQGRFVLKPESPGDILGDAAEKHDTVCRVRVRNGDQV